MSKRMTGLVLAILLAVMAGCQPFPDARSACAEIGGGSGQVATWTAFVDEMRDAGWTRNDALLQSPVVCPDGSNDCENCWAAIVDDVYP